MNPRTGLIIMRNRLCRTLLWLTAIFQMTSLLVSANTSVHTSWLWHLHQPIYWPDRAPANHATDHYQNAWDTIQLGNVQTQVNYSGAPVVTTTQRFYRIQLLP